MSLDVHGIQLPIDAADVSPEIWSALISGQYEANEARRVRRAIQPNDRVLELGAGLGVVTSIIASIEGVRVWSFEADPRTAGLAQRVIDMNCSDNVTLTNGILAAGPPIRVEFFQRSDFWMSSRFAEQGPYEQVIQVPSSDIDTFLRAHDINVLVMDIEGSELELAQHAKLAGVERIFLELHDHLYGLAGVQAISDALARKGLIYDPRGSSGPCVLYSVDDGERQFDAEIAHAT
ncbi:FkbM family methyltransferase [Mesorhizobium australicum]|uniref:Methyltransferase, FkbM family n=1 Tax=Mesorhizobium australicum TaxID=536018 RepID=A0A1X7MR38_9HYPH|nr:FkbM family methyltransferase [Mesorhizobium australicum]SMH26587.1 methyltransferase, FkbM family [Mesorhizobium australicum]